MAFVHGRRTFIKTLVGSPLGALGALASPTALATGLACRPFQMFSTAIPGSADTFPAVPLSYQGVLYPHLAPLYPAGWNNLFLPPERFIRDLAKRYAAMPRICLDIEHLPFSTSTDLLASSIHVASYCNIIRDETPKPVSAYSFLPRQAYWPILQYVRNQQSTGYNNWLAKNAIIFAHLGTAVDVLHPVLYTYYEDRSGWIINAKEMLRQARSLSNRPIYPFLWPRYHMGGTYKSGSHPTIPGDYWRVQLETVYQCYLVGLCDGLVIWDAPQYFSKQGGEAWTTNTPWIRETLAFQGRIGFL